MNSDSLSDEIRARDQAERDRRHALAWIQQRGDAVAAEMTERLRDQLPPSCRFEFVLEEPT